MSQDFIPTPGSSETLNDAIIPTISPILPDQPVGSMSSEIPSMPSSASSSSSSSSFDLPLPAGSSGPNGAATMAALGSIFAPIAGLFKQQAKAAVPEEVTRSVQPWGKFFGDKTKYGLPSATGLPARVKSNFKRFKMNYLLFGLFVVLICALLNFKMLLISLLVFGIWAYFLYIRSEPLTIFGYTLKQKNLTIALSIGK